MVENNEKPTYKSLKEKIEADDEETKKQYKIILWRERHKRILPYIMRLEVFTVSFLFNVMIECKENITRRTITTYLNILYNDNYLDLKVIKTKYKKSAHLYSLKNATQEKFERAEERLTKINLEDEQEEDYSKLEDKTCKSSKAQKRGYAKANIEFAEEQQQTISKKHEEQALQKQQEKAKREEAHRRKPYLRFTTGSKEWKEAKKEYDEKHKN